MFSRRRLVRRTYLRPTSGQSYCNLVGLHISLLGVLIFLSGTDWNFGVIVVEAGFDVTSICDRIDGLSPRQRILCRSYPDVIAAVGDGAKMATSECQFQFRFQRWNCSSNSGNSGSMGSHLQTGPSIIGTREAAFLHAIRSAGVTYSITRSCSQGRVTGCRCARHSATEVGDVRTNKINDRDEGEDTMNGRRPDLAPQDNDIGRTMDIPSNEIRGSWQWGGCGADIAYGTRFSKAFLDARETDDSNTMTLMNLHNNKAGRRALEDSALVTCRCHGMSGSCTARTCWTALPAFRAIGNRLSGAYDRASQVEPVRGRRAMRPMFLKLRRSTSSLSGRQGATSSDRKPSTKRLVFLLRSPDYCSPDDHLGVDGTAGRTCGLKLRLSAHDMTPNGIASRSLAVSSDSPISQFLTDDWTTAAVDHCHTMCCGRGFESRSEVVVRRCRCHFRWCCHVECDTCTDVREELVCR